MVFELLRSFGHSSRKNVPLTRHVTQRRWIKKLLQSPTRLRLIKSQTFDSPLALEKFLE